MRKLLLSLTAFLLFTGTLLAQKTITGTVTDDKGNPLPNVSVVVKGSSTGTITKSDGSYSLTVPAGAKQIEFSFLGFESRTIDLGNNSRHSISLNSAASREMDEVVVTGMTSQKRSTYTGASNRLEVKNIRNQPVGSFDQIFQGRSPGILALTSAGNPGNNTTIIIRGQNSISGGSGPLFVVDGIPVESGVFQNLNPNDFQSIEVFRDASTTALYGSRGSAGVIVVTTKRGVAGKMKVNYTGQMGIKVRPEFSFRPMNSTELLKAQEDYGKILNDPTTNNNTVIPGWYFSKSNPRYATLSPAGQAQADKSLDSLRNINTNWNDEIFNSGGPYSNHQITVSGGQGKTRIYSSVALYNETGTIDRSDMSRVTLRNNIDYADERFTLAISSNLGYTKRNFEQSAAFNTSNPFAISGLAVPYHNVYKPDGSYATGTGTKFVATNQLDVTHFDENYNDQFKGTMSLNMAYKITKDFTAGLVTGLDFRETQNTVYGSKLAYLRLSSSSITGRAGNHQESLTRFLTADVRPTLTYRHTFNDRHEVEVQAVGEYLREFAKNFAFTGFGVDPKRPNTPAAIQQGNAANQLFATVGGRKAKSALVSGLTVGRYTLDDKYTITGSYRYDGSSKLPKATRWQGFYSVGAVWDVSKEKFMDNIRAINMLRLRASYGGSGNSDNFPAQDNTIYTGFFPYQPGYITGSYSGLQTIVPTYAGNPELKWETTFVTNIGLDFELFNRRLFGDLNVYDKRTKDLFVGQKLSATAGFGNGATLDINTGELQNKGVEWNINYQVLSNRNLVWTLFTTGAYNKNKVLSLGGLSNFDDGGTGLVTVGLPLGTHNEVKWAGVDAATGAPLYYTKDGKLTSDYALADPVQTHGTWESPWKGGFGTNLRFKGFEFNVLFSWQQGAKKVDNLEFFLENPVGFMSVGYNQSSDLNFWKQPGDIASTPSPKYPVNFSSKIIHDASFVRLRDITLGYTIPQATIEKTKFISNLRLFVQATNLWMWTKWRGRDPEAGAVNLNISEYPNPRAVTGGIDITF